MSVFIVPMRNWNQGVGNNLTKIGGEFLSYLWGIETHVYNETPQKNKLGFYRTYEELKLGSYLLCLSNPSRFYRTYEELKPHYLAFTSLFVFFRFYRTYEELKPEKEVHEITFWLRFLSYLWGIETLDIDRLIGGGILVFIVPMRNWNPHLPRQTAR